MKVKVELDVDIDGDITFEEAEEFLQYVFALKDNCHVEKQFLRGEIEYEFANLKCKEE